MEEKTLLEQLIDNEIDSYQYFGERFVTKDPYKLLLLIKDKLPTLEDQRVNWERLLKDCKNYILKEYTGTELQNYINNEDVSGSTEPELSGTD